MAKSQETYAIREVENCKHEYAKKPKEQTKKKQQKKIRIGIERDYVHD